MYFIVAVAVSVIVCVLCPLYEAVLICGVRDLAITTGLCCAGYIFTSVILLHSFANVIVQYNARCQFRTIIVLCIVNLVRCTIANRHETTSYQTQH